MTQKRLAALFGAMLLAFSVVMGRLYLLAQNREYARTAQAQTVTTLTLENSRGNLYDCNGMPLTGYGQQYYALSIPGESSYAELFQYVPYSEQAYLYEKRNALAPFLIQVDRDLTDQGIYTYSVPNRYCPLPLAEHLIGYLNGDGSGVAGLEQAFDELLTSGRSAREVQCVTTAQGSLLTGSEPQLLEESGGRAGGNAHLRHCHSAGMRGHCASNHGHRLHSGVGCGYRKGPCQCKYAGICPGEHSGQSAK